MCFCYALRAARASVGGGCVVKRFFFLSVPFLNYHAQSNLIFIHRRVFLLCLFRNGWNAIPFVYTVQALAVRLDAVPV